MQLFEQVRFEGRPVLRGSVAGPRVYPLSRHRESDPEIRWNGCEQQLVQSILQPAGLRLEDYRAAPLARRLSAVLRFCKCSQADQAVAQLRQAPALSQRALDNLLIGHTVAFRDALVFDALRQQVLPRLAPLAPRVWSIGCSRGLELLSVALLLAERGMLLPRNLLGTDCRDIRPWTDPRLASDLLAAADPGLLSTTRWDSPARVERVIDQIQWRQEDALTAVSDDSWDLILCRNLSIYLTPAASARLWVRITRWLAPGGFLVVGKAERPSVEGLVRVGPCLYQRQESAA